MKNVFRQALVNMGYRAINSEETIYGKPIGFGLIGVEIGDNSATFKSIFTNRKGESMLWTSLELNMDLYFGGLEGEALYKKCAREIADKEYTIETDEIIRSRCPTAEPYEFKTKQTHINL